MAFRLLVLICLLNSGFSAEISVFVQTGDSVQLDIQSYELQEFDDLSWIKDKSENIVKFFHASKTVRPHSSYKNRVDFNDTTFSLTLKNMQKTDSGLYTARISGETNNYIVSYRVLVIDAVEAPVLTVNSSWSSPDSCSFTCKGSNITISSIYNSSSCSPEEVTSSDDVTLRLNCSDDIIMCSHSNPVSFKTEKKKVNEVCTVAREMQKGDFPPSASPLWFILLICLLTTSSLASVIGWCLYKRTKDRSYALDQEKENTVYGKVGENITPQKPLEVLEKSKNTSTDYDTVREPETADVTAATTQTSPDQDSSAIPTEKSQPDVPVTIYSTIRKQPKPETDHTVYDEVNKPPAGDESVQPKPE